MIALKSPEMMPMVNNKSKAELRKHWMLTTLTCALLALSAITNAQASDSAKTIPSAKSLRDSATSPSAEAGEEWISLFNGKNLNGWTPKIRGYALNENTSDTFRVEDGVIKVSYDKYDVFRGEYGHLFYKEPFSNYRLKIEYRFVGEQAMGGPGWAFRNSGVMIHGQAPETMGKDQEFPVSIEVQFLGGDGKKERTTANLCTPGTNVVMDGKLHTQHCTNSNSPTFHGDQWVTMEVEVQDGKVRHIIDGKTVLEYEQPQYDESDPTARKLIKGDDKLIKQGYISLQAESHPVEFRRVDILNND